VGNLPLLLLPSLDGRGLRGGCKTSLFQNLKTLKNHPHPNPPPSRGREYYLPTQCEKEPIITITTVINAIAAEKAMSLFLRLKWLITGNVPLNPLHSMAL
jgi:hypothetical protein